ncbi:MAG: TonB-dependent receptor [Burkholderiaceae bacterium]|nr:TonB-dependent receptor [Burkholderiaceae bacterium]
MNHLTEKGRLHPIAMAAAALMLASHCAHAQQSNTALPAITVTATLSEQDARTAPASVTVIDREELAARNASDLLDAVRGAPGLTLSPRQVGGRKTLALRGLEGKHTLTLIDGRRISPSDDVVGHSDYQYGWLPMSAVERIEIIRGPMSALYGSEALGGVINLITRQPKDKWIGSVGVSGSVPTSSHEGESTGSTSVFAAGPLGERLSLRVNAELAHHSPVSNRHQPLLSEIEGSHAKNGDLSARFALTPQQTLEAGWSGGKEQRVYDTDSRGKVFRSTYDIDRSQAHLGWQGKFDGWNSQLRAYRSEIDIVNRASNGTTPTRPQNMVDDVLDGHASFALGAHKVTLGGEWRKETLENAGLKNGTDDATHKALFAQDEIALSDTLMLTAGLRADHHAIFGSEVSPRAYLVWEPTPALVLKGGFGHAFKAPTLKQISPNYVGAEGPHTFAGNGNIRPESSNSFEIGADWQAAPAWSLRATLFNTEVKDLITYRLLRTEGVRRFYQYDNVDAARIRGLEAGMTWTVTRQIAWSNDLTLLHTRDKSTGQKLADRPSTSLTSRLEWQGAEGWSARLSGEFTGSQTGTDGARLPSYALWSASVARQLPLGESRKLVLRAGMENIGNVHLAEKSEHFGYAERARRVFVTARMDF